MKKTNAQKLLVALLVLNITFSYSTSAQAGTFDSLKEKAAKLLEKSKEVGSKALEKGKEITIIVADYANEKLEESKERYDDIQEEKENGSSSGPSNSTKTEEKLEELPKDSQVKLTDSKNSNKPEIISSNNDNKPLKLESKDSSEEINDQSDEHLGTLSEKNPNPSQSKVTVSQEKKVAIFPWENEAPRFQANTQNTVYNSSYSFKRQARDNTQWVLVVATHQESKKEESYIYKNETGEIEASLAFKHGAGNYSIGIYETRESNKNASYFGVQRYTVKNLDTRELLFLQPSMHVQSQDERIVELAKEIVAGSKSQREAVVRINRWLMDNIEYDWSSYRDGSYAGKNYSALTTMETRVAVCQGFANLFAGLARASGIKARVVSGYGVSNVGGGGSHAWNQVYIEGQWLNIDSTWDQGTRSERYIFMSDANFGKTHLNPKINEDF